MVLTLILGCMRSGKTTKLLTFRQGRTLIISHKFDTRADGIKTHDGVEADAVKCADFPDCTGYDTVLIDEVQFFENVEGIENLAPNVVAAGLSGDYKKRKFGKILDLIPLASKVIFLTATCACGADASFTKRISGSTELVSVDSEYISVCEECYK